MRPTSLAIEIPQQPDDSACGPTCLHAVYHYYGDEIPLARVIREVEPLETGGTLAVHLAIHALHRGYSATLYTYNLQLFDPSWFAAGVNLADRLARQAQVKDDAKLRLATAAYLEFLKLGGHVRGADPGYPAALRQTRPTAPDGPQRHVSLRLRARDRLGGTAR
jgi:hypothetical protein